MQNASQMIHIPSYLMEQIGQMRLAMRELEEKLGRPPSHERAGQAHGHHAAQGRPRSRRPSGPARPAPRTRVVDGRDLADRSAAGHAHAGSRSRRSSSQSDADFVSQVLSRITEREALVLKLRYGLNRRNGKRMTLKEIGEAVGLTRERVRQIEKDAARKLLDYVKEYY